MGSGARCAIRGELLFGIILGNLAFLGPVAVSALARNEAFSVLAELGAILPPVSRRPAVHAQGDDVRRRAAMLVAVAGVAAPMALGFGVGELLRPQESWMLEAFLGAMLAATSVGITARVLEDAGALRTRFAPIILGSERHSPFAPPAWSGHLHHRPQ